MTIIHDSAKKTIPAASNASDGAGSPPLATGVAYQTIEELKEARRWLTYQLQVNGEKYDKTKHAGQKIRKVPHVGSKAVDGTNPLEWNTHKTKDLYRQSKPKHLDGVGVAMTGDGLLCIDIDGCIDGYDKYGAFNIRDDVRAILAMTNSFMEISVSGKGIHIYGYGTLPDDIKKPNDKLHIDGQTYELICNNLFVAFTGQSAGISKTLGRQPSDRLENIQAVIDHLYSRCEQRQKPLQATPVASGGGIPTVDHARRQKPLQATPVASGGDIPTVDHAQRQRRLTAWLDSFVENHISDKCADLAARGHAYHDGRLTHGTSLGATLRGLEYAIRDTGITYTLPDLDALEERLYHARIPAEGSQTSERKAIRAGLDYGYNNAASWRDVAGENNQPPAALVAIMEGKESEEYRPKLIDKPYASNASDGAGSPPLATGATSASKTIINVADILQPSEEARKEIEALYDAGVDVAAHKYSDIDDMIAAISERPQPVIYHVNGDAHLLMEGVTILSAGSKLGKSTIVQHFALAVASGSGRVFGSDEYATNGGRVIYYDLENHKGTTGHRMQRMTQYDDKQVYAKMNTIPSKRWQGYLQIAHNQTPPVDRWQVLQWLISDDLRRFDDIRLIILDNVLQFEPKPNKWQQREDMEAIYLSWLAGIASDYKIAFLLVDHSTKATAQDNESTVFAKMQGTFRKGAFVTGGSIAIYKPNKNEEEYAELKLQTQMRDAENITGMYLQRDPVLFSHRIITPPAHATGKRSAAEVKVLKALHDGLTTRGAIVAYCAEFNETRIDQALKALQKDDVIFSPKKGTWHLQSEEASEDNE